MASNKTIRFGPVAVSNSVGNIFNPPTVTGGVNAGQIGDTVAIIRHIRVLNKNASSRSFTAYLGATGGSAAGTEIIGKSLVIAGNSYHDYYDQFTMTSSDFLTAVSSDDATSLVIMGSGEAGVS